MLLTARMPNIGIILGGLLLIVVSILFALDLVRTFQLGQLPYYSIGDIVTDTAPDAGANEGGAKKSRSILERLFDLPVAAIVFGVCLLLYFAGKRLQLFSSTVNRGLLLAGPLLLVADMCRALIDGSFAYLALGEFWYKNSPNTLNGLQVFFQRHVENYTGIGLWLWDPVMVAVLLGPIWLPILVLGLAVYGVGRWFDAIPSE